MTFLFFLKYSLQSVHNAEKKGFMVPAHEV